MAFIRRCRSAGFGPRPLIVGLRADSGRVDCSPGANRNGKSGWQGGEVGGVAGDVGRVRFCGGYLGYGLNSLIEI